MPDPIQQRMLCFAYGADTELTSLSGDDAVDAATLQGLINTNVLPNINQTFGDGWQLAWGPYVKTEPYLKFGSWWPSLKHRIVNVMYAATNGTETTVAIAGTDFRSLYDVVFEDLDVLLLRDWSSVYAKTPAPRGAKISEAAKIGIDNLIGATPVSGLPGAGTTIADFFDANVQSGTTLYVTGHSLGGSLSAVLSLWVADRQSVEGSWSGASIVPVCFAGPTPGNDTFAAYFDGVLPGLQRVWNAYDVVPNAWNEALMEAALAQYQSPANSNPPTRSELTAFNAAIGVTKDKDYTQPQAGAPALDGPAFESELSSFICQIFYQHIFVYPDVLGVTLPTTPEMPAGCPSTPPR